MKINDIEYFLNLIKEISKNDIKIDSNLVYSNLIRLNTLIEPTLKYFPDWQERFNYKDNINVFVTDNEYFCQFTSDNLKTNKIKIYIPLDKEHIYEGVNMIFDFLLTKGISHKSKVCGYTRVDDVIVSVNSEYDADMLCNYINNNDYIKEGLITPNPFLFINENVGITCDTTIPYNTVVSDYISNYINSKKDENTLDEVSFNDFYSYVLNTYNNIFNKGIDINEFSRERGFNNVKEDLLSYESVSKIILYSLNPNTNKSIFYDEIDKVFNQNYVLNMSKKIDLLLKKDNMKVMDDTAIETFNGIFVQMCKHEDEKKTIERLKIFIKTNNYSVFTRANNIRNNMISSSLTVDDVASILINIEKDVLLNASKKTLSKYDATQLIYALKYAKTGDYNKFTNDDSVRDELKIYINPNEINALIKRILKDNGYTIESINEIDEKFVNMIEGMQNISK